MAKNASGAYRCSFCGKSDRQVNRLIAGTGGVAICDDCVKICNDILCKHTGQPREKVMADTERDNFMTAEDAKVYGLIDDVITRPVKTDFDKDEE